MYHQWSPYAGAQPLDQLPRLLLDVGDPGEGDRRHRGADRQHVARVRLHVPDQRLRAGAAASPTRRATTSTRLRSRSSPAAGRPRRRALGQRAPHVDGARPALVPEHRQRGVAGREVGVEPHRLEERLGAPDCSASALQAAVVARPPPRRSSTAAAPWVARPAPGSPTSASPPRPARRARAAATAAAWPRISGTAVDSHSSPRRIAPSVQTGAALVPRASTSRPSSVARPRPSGPGCRHAGGQQVVEERVACARTSPSGTGAVDHRGDPDDATRPQPHLEPPRTRADPDDLVGARPSAGRRAACRGGRPPRRAPSGAGAGPTTPRPRGRSGHGPRRTATTRAHRSADAACRRPPASRAARGPRRARCARPGARRWSRSAGRLRRATETSSGSGAAAVS